MELYHKRHFLPTSILEIVLKVSETNESVSCLRYGGHKQRAMGWMSWTQTSTYFI